MEIDLEGERGRGIPRSTRSSMSRMSDTPGEAEQAAAPVEQVSSSSIDMPARRARWKSTAGSMSPERVPMTSPSSGVRPIDVSTERPPSIAVTEAPLPRWSTICLSSASGRPRNAAAASATNLCDVPWNP